MTEEKIMTELDALPILFGEYDNNIKKIEKNLNVLITNRDGMVKIMGDEKNVKMAGNVINQLLDLTAKQKALEEQNVDYAIEMALESSDQNVSTLYDDFICVTTRGKYIRPKTFGQKKYLEMLNKHMIVFGVGPAGTGKTYIAMAKAITAFKNNEVSRIILTRPAIEAGEKLGFLPGDLQSKVDPYLRPLYDALYEIMGAETFLKNMEKGLIEVAPLAYMRGRTLDNAYIILDEAQNTTPAQMKMFLTRIGFGSKAIITGDITQKDLPFDKQSGLESAMKILKNIDEVGICKLTSKDVVRHPLVQKIINAYEKEESRSKHSAVDSGTEHGTSKH